MAQTKDGQIFETEIFSIRARYGVYMRGGVQLHAFKAVFVVGGSVTLHMQVKFELNIDFYF